MAPTRKTRVKVEDIKGPWVLVEYVNLNRYPMQYILSTSQLNINFEFMQPQMRVQLPFEKITIPVKVLAVSEDLKYLQKNRKALIALASLPVEEAIEKYIDLTLAFEKLMKEHEPQPEKNLEPVKPAVPIPVPKLEEEEPIPPTPPPPPPQRKVRNKPAPKEEEEPILPPPPSQSKVENKPVPKTLIEEKETKYLIGKNKTPIPKEIFKKVNWKNSSTATRQLLMALFSRKVLGTHTLSGKASPAFLNANKELKPQLDANITSDIIEVVSFNCGISCSTVRSHITSKCADENKMRRRKQL